MLKHIVMWTIKEAPGTSKANITSEMKAKLLSLLGKVPTLRTIEVGTNAPGTPESNFDIILVTTFDDVDGLNAYQAHPAHLEVAGYIKTVVDKRTCVDYMV